MRFGHLSVPVKRANTPSLEWNATNNQITNSLCNSIALTECFRRATGSRRNSGFLETAVMGHSFSTEQRQYWGSSLRRTRTPLIVLSFARISQSASRPPPVLLSLAQASKYSVREH